MKERRPIVYLLTAIFILGITPILCCGLAILSFRFSPLSDRANELVITSLAQSSSEALPTLAATEVYTPASLLGEDLPPIPAHSPQAQALREAKFLLVEGDRLEAQGKVDEAREKWLEAVAAYQEAGDRLGESNAYLRLADSYNYSGEVFLSPQKRELTLDYYQEALFAAAEVYETLIQKELDFDQETLQEADKLYQQGFEHFQAGECKQALEFLDRAKKLYDELDFDSGKVRVLLIKARCHMRHEELGKGLLTTLHALMIVQQMPLGTPASELYLKGQHQYEQRNLAQAEATFQEALEQYREIDNQAGMAQVTLDLANIYAIRGEFVRARKMYTESLEIFIEQEDEYNQAAVYHNLGNLEVQTGYFTEAITHYRQAIDLWQGYPENEVASLNGMGLALIEQTHYPEAVATLEEALALQQQLATDTESEGDILNSLGKAYFAWGHYQQALHFFEQALSLQKEASHRQKEAEIQSNIASVQARLGRFDEAMNGFQTVLAMASDLDLPILATRTYINIATVYAEQADYQRAIVTYLKVLPSVHQNKDRLTEATIYLNIGSAYIRLGDLDEAESYYNRAKQLFEQMDSPANVATVQGNLGMLALQKGDLVQAKTYLEEALATWRELENPVLISQTLGNLALLALSQKEFETALEQSQEAIQLSEQVGNRTDKARFLIILAGTYLSEGDYGDALEQSLQALNLAQQIGEPTTELAAYSLLAATHYAQEEPDQAFEYIQTAIDKLETLQGTITVSELKTAFLGNLFDIYSLAVSLAIELDRPEMAFQFAEQGRSRAFLDQLANGSVDFQSGIGSDLLDQEQDLRYQIIALRTQLVQLRSLPQDEATDQEIGLVETELHNLEETYTRLLRDIKLQSPQLASLVSVDPVSLNEAQRLLEAETTLIEYFVTEEATYAFVLNKDFFQVVTLEVDQQQLFQRIAAFRDFPILIQEADSPPENVQQLYTWLVEPLQPHLNTTNLVIVPHNILHYLPFAALSDGQHYLNERYILSNLPSASSLRFLPEEQKRRESILVLGNPTSPANLPPLSFAQQEAKTVADLYHTQPLLGSAATEESIWRQAGQKDIVHISAHGSFNINNPLFSAIYLAESQNQDGRLEVHEIYNLELSQTDLVVLSACQTDLGRLNRRIEEGNFSYSLALSKGDEITNLTRAFFFARTPTVVASLWSVDDEATGLLMEQFHTHLKQGENKAAALSSAQQEVQTQYPDPYYWSAFVLSGRP